MAVKSQRVKGRSTQRYDVKKLFGSNFREPTPAEYAATRLTTVEEVLAELNEEATSKERTREALLSRMKSQVKQMKRSLSELEKQLLKF